VEHALRNLHDVSYVLVTHDERQASRLASQVVRIENGRIKR